MNSSFPSIPQQEGVLGPNVRAWLEGQGQDSHGAGCLAQLLQEQCILHHHTHPAHTHLHHAFHKINGEIESTVSHPASKRRLQATLRADRLAGVMKHASRSDEACLPKVLQHSQQKPHRTLHELDTAK